MRVQDCRGSWALITGASSGIGREFSSQLAGAGWNLATKAFVHSFSQALYGEWKSRGVTVQTLVPGPTATEFDSLAGAYETRLRERDSPVDVVRASLAHLEGGEPLCVPAKGTWKQSLFAALFPTKTVIDRVGRMFLPPPDHHPRVG